jgi:hypothetical protein
LSSRSSRDTDGEARRETRGTEDSEKERIKKDIMAEGLEI